MTELERSMLAFEAANEGPFPRKESLIREAFQTSAAKYYMKLNRLLDTADAAHAYPMLVRRWRDRQSLAQKRTHSRLLDRRTDARSREG